MRGNNSLTAPCATTAAENGNGKQSFEEYTAAAAAEATADNANAAGSTARESGVEKTPQPVSAVADNRHDKHSSEDYYDAAVFTEDKFKNSQIKN